MTVVIMWKLPPEIVEQILRHVDATDILYCPWLYPLFDVTLALEENFTAACKAGHLPFLDYYQQHWKDVSESTVCDLTPIPLAVMQWLHSRGLCTNSVAQFWFTKCLLRDKDLPTLTWMLSVFRFSNHFLRKHFYSAALWCPVSTLEFMVRTQEWTTEQIKKVMLHASAENLCWLATYFNIGDLNIYTEKAKFFRRLIFYGPEPAIDTGSLCHGLSYTYSDYMYYYIKMAQFKDTIRDGDIEGLKLLLQSFSFLKEEVSYYCSMCDDKHFCSLVTALKWGNRDVLEFLRQHFNIKPGEGLFSTWSGTAFALKFVTKHPQPFIQYVYKHFVSEDTPDLEQELSNKCVS